ncbi:MAG: DUF2142 domain-containing protein [Bacteroidota bacterium]
MNTKHLSIQERLLNLRPDIVFLVLASSFGLFFVFSNPPFQGPDEVNHFYRAYAISTGQWEPDTSLDRRGGTVPLSVVQMVDTFAYLRWYANQRTSTERVFPFSDRPLQLEQVVFKDYPNTALYPATVYLPQAAVIALSRRFDFSVLTTFRLTRLVGLLLWLAVALLALHWLPAFRWLFVLLLLLPMSVYTHATVSADTTANVVALLTIAYLLRLIFEPRKIGYPQLLTTITLGVLLASTKIFYLPILALAFLIPRKRFEVKGGKWGATIIVAGFSLMMLAFWSGRLDGIYLPYSEYAIDYRDGLDLPSGTNAREQRSLISHSPLRLLKGTWNSISDAGEMYFKSFIGTLGNLDTHLPWVVIIFAYLNLIFVGRLDRSIRLAPDLKQKSLFGGVFLLCYVLVVFSQLLSWEPVGSTTVGTIQGRYLMPFAPLLFLLLIRQGKPKSWLGAYVAATAALFLFISASVMYQRYYEVPNAAQVTKVYCDAELAWDKYYCTEGDYPFLLDFSRETRSDEAARSGDYAAKVRSPSWAYALSCHLFDCHPGDTLSAQVWKKGATGRIVLTSRDNSSFYRQEGTADLNEEDWSRLSLEVVLPADFIPGHGLTCFVTNAQEQAVYFDDFQLRYARKKP